MSDRSCMGRTLPSTYTLLITENNNNPPIPTNMTPPAMNSHEKETMAIFWTADSIDSPQPKRRLHCFNSTRSKRKGALLKFSTEWGA